MKEQKKITDQLIQAYQKALPNLVAPGPEKDQAVFAFARSNGVTAEQVRWVMDGYLNRQHRGQGTVSELGFAPPSEIENEVKQILDAIEARTKAAYLAPTC